MAEIEPQYASDYDDRTMVAVKSVLVEIGQVLEEGRQCLVEIGVDSASSLTLVAAPEARPRMRPLATNA